VSSIPDAKPCDSLGRLRLETQKQQQVFRILDFWCSWTRELLGAFPRLLRLPRASSTSSEISLQTEFENQIHKTGPSWQRFRKTSSTPTNPRNRQNRTACILNARRCPLLGKVDLELVEHLLEWHHCSQFNATEISQCLYCHLQLQSLNETTQMAHRWSSGKPRGCFLGSLGLRLPVHHKLHTSLGVLRTTAVLD
jgi:hypothetical protein